MKKAIKLSFALLALMGVLFTSCKKDYPTPPIQSLPIGEVYTIGDLLAMESGTVFNEDASVYGIITADEKSGNLYKAAFMQDRATGDAIELYLDATSGVRIGDSVRIYLKDVTYALYNGLPQLSGFEADGHIVILANDKPIPPEETTIADIVAGHHLGGLVKLNNVMFTDKGTFAEPSTYGNRTLVDPTNLTQSVIVRTSNYANFANDSLPQGVGNLVAIATVYNTTWQLLIRSAKELEFDGYEPGGDGGVITLPYYQSFASNFGTYTTFDALGAQSWMIDYSTAKMAGYENSVNYANEDWLISSQFSLEDVSSASLTMTYIARYFNNLNEDITIQVSEDYQEGDPNDAQWTWVPASWTSGNNWTDFAQTTVDLSDFVGKKVRVAVKYLSTDAKAGTIEVQSIAIQEGAGPTPPPGPGPSGEVQSLPYVQSFTSEFGTYLTKDISGAQSWMIDYSTAKMTGYDNNVNYENEDWLISSPVALTGVSDAKMTITYIARYFNNLNEDITFWASSGYTYGDDPYSAQWTQVPATLVSGSNWTDFATTEIGLKDFVGETVTIAVKYLSTSVKAGTIEIKSIAVEEGSGPTPPPGPGPSGEVQNLPYVQSFTSEFGTYLTKDISGAQSWMIDFSTAKMTGYDNSVNYENEDWLISSPVALTGVNEAKMTIIYIARYFNNLNEDITFWVSSGYTYGDDPYSAQWTQVPATLVSGSNWTDFATTEIGLKDFVGETVTIAVKYLSTSVKAGTIEIQSIAIEEGSGPTPPPGPGTGEGTGTQDDPYNVASGISLQNQDVVAWVRGYIVGCVKPDLSLVASNDDISWEGPYRLATNVLIADAPDVKDISRCVFVNLPSGKPLRTEVNLVDHPENIGKVLTVKGKLRTYFQQAGLRDSGGTQNDFILEGYVPPTPPEPEGIFSESFFNGQGSFTIQDVVMPDDLTYIWAHNSTYQCMKASAYKDYAHEAESWLISPAIEIPLMNIITLTFEQAVNYASPEGRLSIMVTTDFTGDVTQTEWTEVQLDSWPTGDNWDFITSSGNLSDYMGQTIVFAFKYTSNENVSATWEVKNIVINY